VERLRNVRARLKQELQCFRVALLRCKRNKTFILAQRIRVCTERQK
jgi:hypothetical protein